MDEDGLGTLAVLPREVRDIISSYVVASLKLSGSCYGGQYDNHEIPLRSFIHISKQLRREFLESFLRDDDFVDSNHQNIVIRDFLHDMSPLVDIAPHARAIGVAIRSRLFAQYDERRVNYSISQSQYSDESSYVFKGVHKLRSYHHLYDIPWDKLHITITYPLPCTDLTPARTRRFDSVDMFILGITYKHDRRIRIHPNSKSRSLSALEDECARMLLGIHKRLSIHLEEVRAAKQHGSEDNALIARQMRSRKYCKKIIPALVSAMHGYHERMIDQVMQVWQEAEEFDEYCLGDFFALAEAW
ncbi:hypothetical protein KCU95_g6579, partial [Aureobasidium melanogenum]